MALLTEPAPTRRHRKRSLIKEAIAWERAEMEEMAAVEKELKKLRRHKHQEDITDEAHAARHMGEW